MKRFTAIRILSSCLEPNDIALFAGNNVCEAAYKYHRVGNLYLDNLKSPAAVALGIANGTDKRVFIFCEDSTFVEDLSTAAQIAVSRCRNIFYVILISGEYIKDMPTIFNSLIAPKGMLFNMGFIVHNYDNYFKITKSYKEINAIWSRAKGPLAAFVTVEATPTPTIQIENDMEKFSEFVKDISLGSSLFNEEIKADNAILVVD